MAPTSCLIFRRDLNTVAIALFHRFSGPIVWYTSWLDADIKSYKSLQFAGVPDDGLFSWLILFRTVRYRTSNCSKCNILFELFLYFKVIGCLFT